MKREHLEIGHVAKSVDGEITEFTFTVKGEMNSWFEEFLRIPEKSKLFNSFVKSISMSYEAKDVTNEDL